MITNEKFEEIRKEFINYEQLVQRAKDMENLSTLSFDDRKYLLTLYRRIMDVKYTFMQILSVDTQKEREL
jgi:hypothetical protein